MIYMTTTTTTTRRDMSSSSSSSIWYIYILLILKLYRALFFCFFLSVRREVGAWARGHKNHKMPGEEGETISKIKQRTVPTKHQHCILFALLYIKQRQPGMYPKLKKERPSQNPGEGGEHFCHTSSHVPCS